MSYLGNSPELNTFTVGVEKFNGSGACTVFTLTRDIDDPNYLEVVVGGVQQTPYDSYTVTNGLITFVTPPILGTNNVVVIYRTGTTIAYNQIAASQLLAGSVSETSLASGSVTNTKLGTGAITGDKLANQAIISGNNIGVNAVSGNNIGIGAISGNQIGASAVSGNQIGASAISGNQIGASAISGNQIGAGAISGNQIGASAISGNNIGINSINASNSIVALSITGNLIGTGAISANNFAGGGVGSDSLAQNLTLSTVRIAETINVVTSPVSGNYQIYVADTGVYYFTANATGSVTFNLIGRQGTSLNDLISTGQTASVAIMLKQGSTRYRANVQVDGVLQTCYWLGNTQPSQASSLGQTLDVYNFTVIKTENNGYTVLASNSAYAQANGQGMGPGATQ